MTARTVTYSVTFNPSAQTINLSGIPGFDVRNLYAILDATTGQTIYAVGYPGQGYSAIDSTGTILTLETPLVGTEASPTDIIWVKYDDGAQIGGAGFLQLVTNGAIVGPTNGLPVSATSNGGALALDATIQAVNTNLGFIGSAPPTLPNSSTGIKGLLLWLGGLLQGLLPVSLPGCVTPSAVFSRPLNTTAYSTGYLVANSTTAGLVVPMSLSVSRANGTSVNIYRARLTKNSTSTTNAQFRAHLYTASPVPANGDGATWSTSQSANYCGSFDVTMDKAFSDGANGDGLPTTGTRMIVVPGSGQQTIYALLEARAAYTPVSGESFQLTLETERN